MLAAAFLGGLLLTAPLGAQEISPVFDMGGLANAASLGAVIQQEQERAGVQPSNPLRSLFAQPAPADAANLPMDYAATPEVRRQALADFIARIRQNNPQDADAAARELQRNDYAAIYDGIVQPYGLAGNDAANALTAYLVLGWMIVHDGQEPPREAIAAARGQAAVALSDMRLSAPETRARLGEEFKILFVVLHAGWQSAQRESTVDRYTAGVAALFERQDGLNLRQMTLGRDGFRPG
jgi:hypothetical protein